MLLERVEKSVTLGPERVWRAMYCPQCKAEYRQGFTRCSDCDVELVRELHATTDGFGAPGEAGESVADSDDPICSFWQGDDPRIHAEICELLNEQGIPHKTIRREDHLFNLNSKSGFQIGIPYSQFEKAEAAIKDAYGTEEDQQDAARLLPYADDYGEGVRGVFPWKTMAKGYARALLGQGEEGESEAAPLAEQQDTGIEPEQRAADWDPVDWNREEATVRVWTSDESYPGEIIKMALRENQIHARFEKTEGRNAIFILPADEIRAREIVREIVESAPPE
jgi:hypothetical protein